jgi:hypothetical protein
MKEIRRRTRRRCFPRRSVLPQPGGRATTVHRRHNMVGQMLYEHATTHISRTYLKPKPLHDRMCERFWTLPATTVTLR